MRRGLVLGVALMLLTVACSNGSSGGEVDTTTTLAETTTSTLQTTTSSSTTTTEAPRSGPGYGGEAIVAIYDSPPTLNLWGEQGNHLVTTVVAQMWMTGAWDIDAEALELIPDVVVELPTTANGGLVVNDDGTMTVTYHIVPEARWDDGVPISGQDFDFTVSASLRTEAAREFGHPYTDADIVATDAQDKTFSMTLRRPTLQYEKLFQWILPSHALDETTFPVDWDGTLWPAGGPFKVVDADLSRRVLLERNENYWKTDAETGMQLPYLDSVEVVVIFESSEQLRAFRNREVDVIDPSPDINTVVEPLIAMADEGVETTVRPGPAWEHLGFQFGPGRFERSENSCNENLKFRRAVIHALNRGAVASEAYQGYGVAMSSYVDAFTPSLSTRNWDAYTYDPGLANDLYQEAVAETGRPCEVVFSTTSNAELRPRLADFYADMFAAAGIPYRQELLDSQVFFQEVFDAGTWDLGQWAWVGSSGMSGLVAIHDVFDPRSPKPRGDNVYNWGVPGSSVIDEHTERFAELVDAMNSTVDTDEIATLVAEAQSILAEQAVIVPLFGRIAVGAVWADEIGGYEFNPSEAGHTWNIEYWYRTDR